MTRANNSKWMCILAFVLMVIPAVVSVGQAAAAPGAADRAMSSTAASVRSEPVGKLQLNGPRGICPFHCNSSSACTIGCQTEALCIDHHCIAL